MSIPTAFSLHLTSPKRIQSSSRFTAMMSISSLRSHHLPTTENGKNRSLLRQRVSTATRWHQRSRRACAFPEPRPAAAQNNTGAPATFPQDEFDFVIQHGTFPDDMIPILQTRAFPGAVPEKTDQAPVKTGVTALYHSCSPRENLRF